MTNLFESFSDAAFIKISDIAATSIFSRGPIVTSTNFVFVMNSRCFKKNAWTVANMPQGPPSF